MSSDNQSEQAKADYDDGSSAPKVEKKGHPIGFWFFFWGEFAERCSYYGMRAILAKYMVDKFGINQADAATYMSFFIAGCYLLPLLGGYLADNFLGKYNTIVGFSLPYVIGQVIIGFENPYLLVISLALLAMGSGVIKPNISTLMGLTYDQQRPGQDKLRSDAFSLFYMAINVGAFLSQISMPFLRTKYGYQIAFAFPAVLMIIALAVFAAGKRFYAKEVIVRKKSTPEETKLKFQTLGKIMGLFLLVTFFWAIFDQAASTWIFFADDFMNCKMFGVNVSADAIQGFNPLFIVGILPLTMLFWRFLGARGINVRPTDKMLAGFILTGVTMVMMGVAAMLNGSYTKRIWVSAEKVMVSNIPGIDKASESFVSETPGKLKLMISKPKEGEEPKYHFLEVSGNYEILFKKSSTDDQGETTLESVTIQFTDGIITDSSENSITFKNIEKTEEKGKVKFDGNEATLGEGEAGKKVADKKYYIANEKKVSVWWQVLAYLVLTVAEILISVTGLELAFVAAPKSMKSFVTACWLLTVFCANFFINAPVTRLYPKMEPGMYFFMLAVTMGVVTIAFIFMARKFNKSMAERPSDI